MRLARLFMACMFIIAGITTSAQWTDDPLTNTLIDGNSGEQSVPHITTTSSGNFYISYYTNASQNYDVALHYLNSQGEPIWDEPLVVSNNEQYSWVTDYSLTIDNEDNAIVAFTDARNGSLDVFIYKVDEQGEQVWGENGIQLSFSSDDDYVPKLAVTENNNTAVVWTHPTDSTIILQKLDPEGNLLWGENGIAITPDGEYYNDNPNIIVMSGEKIYLNYSHLSGPYWSPDRYMYVQLLGDDGTNLWDDEVLVFDAGGLSGLTELSTKLTEQKDLVFAWYDDRYMDWISDPYIQRIDSTGNLIYETNGLLLSNVASNNHFNPTIAGETSNNELVILWTETDGDQNARGVYGQKVGNNGTLEWGDAGMAFEDLGTVVNMIGCNLHNDSAIYYYNKPLDIYDAIYANKIDNNGEKIWQEASAVTTNDKFRAHVDYATGEPYNQVVLVWGEERESSRDLYAQNLNFDGSLGVDNTVWEAEILSYSMNDTEGSIDSESRTITIELGEIEDNQLTATFSLSEGASAYINDTEQISGTTANEFTSGEPISYSIVSQDNTITNTWQVTVSFTLVGVSNMSIKPNIYPNPANSQLVIKNCMNGKIKIRNLAGQIIEQYKSTSNEYIINTSSIHSGIYLVEIQNDKTYLVEQIAINH